MLETITYEVRNKLEDIGFEKDEIYAFEIIHELKKKKYLFNIEKVVHNVVLDNYQTGLINKINELSWEMGREKINREELYDR